MKNNTLIWKSFSLGFEKENFPIKLHDNSYANDVFPSFFFRTNGNYYILWVDFEKKESREDPSSKRYSIINAINEGDDLESEVYSDNSQLDLLQTDDVSTLFLFVESLTKAAIN